MGIDTGSAFIQTHQPRPCQQAPGQAQQLLLPYCKIVPYQPVTLREKLRTVASGRVVQLSSSSCLDHIIAFSKPGISSIASFLIPCDRPEPPSPTRIDSSCMPNPAWTSTAGDSKAKPPNPKNRERLVGVLCCLGLRGALLSLLGPVSVLRMVSLQSAAAVLQEIR